ncbi:MAG: hypothetical protein ACKVP0_05410 [Pirellulaceae bacterium]
MKYSLRIDRAIDRFRRAGIDIRAISESPWVDEIETTIGGELPEVYRSLITRYSFPVLDLGPIELFSNLGDGTADEITLAPFRDPILSRWLIHQGYFHFARLTSDSYDPVCFSIRPMASPKEPLSVVRFDHEAILLEQATVRQVQFAESFLGLLEGAALDSQALAPKPF